MLLDSPKVISDGVYSTVGSPGSVLNSNERVSLLQ